jgi:hypothetical protein
VSFKQSLDDDDTDGSGSSRAASPLPAAAAAGGGSSSSNRSASPRHRRIMRCNTMPVQQAEAMEQLLRQVSFGQERNHVK